MSQPRHGHRQSLLLAATLVVAGCQTAPQLPAPSALPSTAMAAVGSPLPTTPAGAPGAGTVLPSGVVVPPNVRVVYVIPEPKLGGKETVSNYWDYGKDAPFDVKQYVSVTSSPTAGPNYAAHTSTTAQVSLLNLLGAHYRVMAQGATAATPPMAAGCDPAPPMTIGAATPASSPIAMASPTHDANGSANIPATDDAQVIGAAPVATAVSAVNQPDAFSAQALSASEAGPDPSFPPVSQAAQYLSKPHRVDVEAEMPWIQFNGNCLVTVVDQTTGDTLKLEYDQNFQHFTLTGAGGSLSFEINPDGSYLLDGQGAADIAALLPLVEASPVIQKSSVFSLAMLVARLARMAPPQFRAGSGVPGNQGGAQGYRVLGTSSDNQGLCYVILDAVLKYLIKTRPTS